MSWVDSLAGGAIETGDLVPPAELFARAAGSYRDRWKLVLTIILLGSSAILASFLAAGAVSLGSLFFASRMSDVVVIMAVMSAVAFSAAALVWSQAALLLAAAGPGPAPGLAACLEAAWRKLPGFCLTCCLYLAACLGGFFLLVLPGFAAGLWLSFAPLIYLTEEVGPLEALLKSCHYVRGRSLPLAGRLCLVSAAGSLPGLIPIAGAVMGMLAWPFVWMNMAALLDDLRRLRRDEPFAPLRRMKMLLFSVMAGCLIPVVLLPWVLSWLSRYLIGHTGQLMQMLSRGLPLRGR